MESNRLGSVSLYKVVANIGYFYHKFNSKKCQII